MGSAEEFRDLEWKEVLEGSRLLDLVASNSRLLTDPTETLEVIFHRLVLFTDYPIFVSAIRRVFC